MHAITLTYVNYDVLSETEWEGRHAVRLSPDIPRCFLRKADIDADFEEDGNQVKPVAVRTTADPAAVDTLLSRAGWTRKPATTCTIFSPLVRENKNIFSVVNFSQNFV